MPLHEAIVEQIRKAVEAEREACARLCEGAASDYEGGSMELDSERAKQADVDAREICLDLALSIRGQEDLDE